jgi:hypothetical protein
MAAVNVQHFLDRARDFLKGKDLLRDEKLLGDDLSAYRLSSALLGIHCAISYSDALRTGMGSTTLSSGDHKKAASDLESLLKSQNYKNRKGIGHLKELLGKKSKVAYHPLALRENDVEEIAKHTKRFADWAEEAGRKLKIEGW